LDSLLVQGLDFRLALLGENFNTIPPVFDSARQRYGDRIVQYGYVESRNDYLNWLTLGDIVVSTARQENFGIAVVEAIRHGCLPILPERLSYPEILPKPFHAQVLYKDQAGLVEKISHFITNGPHLQTLRDDLSTAMERFAWENVIQRYDQELEQLAGR